MPPAAPRPCTYPGCAALVRSGRCEKHPKPKGWQDDTAAKLYDRRRGSAASRGYDSRWRRIRNAYIASEPLCEWCRFEGRVVRAEIVDHIIPLNHGGTISGPVQSLCRSHHLAKSLTDGSYKRR